MSPTEVGKRVAAHFVASPHQDPQRIIYPEVCAWYGALTFAHLSVDKELLASVIHRFDLLLRPEHAGLIQRTPHVDFSVFGAVPLQIYIETKDPKYLDLGKWFADRQWENPRPDGLSPETRFWIDDMYMETIVQVQAFRATGDAKYLDRASLEMVAYLDKLQQPDGLFYHEPEVQFYWGRGNGWVAAGMAELLRSLPKDHPRRARILEGYQKMMKSLLEFQGPDGMWRQLIDRPDSWPETLQHRHVHLRHGHRRQKRLAGRGHLRTGGAQGVAGAGGLHRPERRRHFRLRRHQQARRSGLLHKSQAPDRRFPRTGAGVVDGVGTIAIACGRGIPVCQASVIRRWDRPSSCGLPVPRRANRSTDDKNDRPTGKPGQ